MFSSQEIGCVCYHSKLILKLSKLSFPDSSLLYWVQKSKKFPGFILSMREHWSHSGSLFSLLTIFYHIFCIFLLIALNLFSRAAVFTLVAYDFLCFWSFADILNFPLLLWPHFFATTVTKAFNKSQFQEYNGVISEVPSRKIILTFSYAQSEAS